MENQLQRALNEMPNVFSSNEFGTHTKRYGVTKKQINAGVLAKFLHRNAVQLSSKRMWRKKNPDNLFSMDNADDQVQDAIKLLKSLGYRVLKPVTEYQEL